MARSFTAASSDFLSVAAIPNITYPFTFGCRFKVPDTTRYALVSLGDISTSNNWFVLFADSDVRLAAQSGGTESFTNGTVTYSTDTWGLAVGVVAAANSRAAYFNDGGTDGPAGSTRDPTGVDTFRVGEKASSAGGSNMEGEIAEVFFYADLALSADEIARISSGISPELVRPDKLAGYWPLFGKTDPEPNVLFEPHNLTVTGAVAAAHPRVLYQTRPRIISVPALALGSPYYAYAQM